MPRTLRRTDTRRTDKLPRASRAFSARQKIVRYAGLRWKLVADRGAWVFIARRGVEQWVPSLSVSR